MSQFQSQPNYQQVHVKTPVILLARPTEANTNLDGTGTLAQFTGDDPMVGKFGARFTSVRILSEDATPADTYRLFISGPGSGAPRLVYSKTISAEQTVEQLDDFVLPAGWMVYASSNAGDNATITLWGGRFD